MSETIVVVGGGAAGMMAAIAAAERGASGYPIERLNEIPWSDNTAVSLLRFDDNMHCKIVFQNDSSHLPDEYNPKRGRIGAAKEDPK